VRILIESNLNYFRYNSKKNVRDIINKVINRLRMPEFRGKSVD